MRKDFLVAQMVKNLSAIQNKAQICYCYIPENTLRMALALYGLQWESDPK